jgi:hypothetical protein
MKRLLIGSLYLGLAVAVFSGCDDQLDINTDPLAATEVDPNLLFPEAVVQLSNYRESELDARIGTIPQYYMPSTGVLGDYAQGSLGNTFLMGNVWSGVYAFALKNTALIERDALLAPEGTRDNVIAQAQIYKAYIFYMATMLWEDVPYTEAADFVTALPNFDDQETILRGLVSDLDAAIARIDDDPEDVPMQNGDLIYDGDMSNWERFANSLKLSILMAIANVDPESVRAQIADVVNQPLIETWDQAAALHYLDSPGNFNPWWNVLNRFSGGQNNFYYAAEVPFNLLEELDDPRLPVFFDQNRTTNEGEYGDRLAAGVFTGGRDLTALSLTVISPDRSDVYQGPAQTLLLKAEAIQRGYAEGDADEAYRAGIVAAMNRWDDGMETISDSAETAYLASLPELDNLGDEEALEAIHTQLYLGLYSDAMEGWIQWRRTGVPTLQTVRNSRVAGIIRRFFFPPDEIGANPNSTEAKPLDFPMWYEGE